MERFRKLVLEPERIPFARIRFKRILDYYPAGNDVMLCLDESGRRFVLKLARHSDADFGNHARIAGALPELGMTRIQEVIEHGILGGVEYLALSHACGYRISQEPERYDRDRKKHCARFGANLANIHGIELDAPAVRARKFHTPPPIGETLAAGQLVSWLRSNEPSAADACFIHGDHHNANVLWTDGDISCVLDWELAGRGDREFDLAWAIVARPGQAVFTSREEEDDILEGYSRIRAFDPGRYRYFKALILSHFAKFGDRDRRYREWMTDELTRLTGIETTS